MGIKLISHVNADNDLIEAWLKYYVSLGVDSFHFVMHGDADDNRTLLSLKDSFPIFIEDQYEGPFLGEDKKNRLNVVLARYTKQWILLVDSDEFVEFPYEDIPGTIGMLTRANANLMAAPMIQRLTADGSLRTPPVIENPFQVFPLCSADLYRRMGCKGDIFKFPLFLCANNTRLAGEGNHYPPLGCDPRGSGIRGVTHHFKFRTAVSERLYKRINSEYEARHESVQFRDYLEDHSNRLPLDGTFVYSRGELFRRRLLRKLEDTTLVNCPAKAPANNDLKPESALKERGAKLGAENKEQAAISRPTGRRIVFLLPKVGEFGDLENYLISLLRSLEEEVQRPEIICLDQDTVSEVMEPELRSKTVVKCVPEPKSFLGWFRLIRAARPDIVVFCYRKWTAFPWQAPVASLIAGVRRRIAIQHLVPIPPPPLVEGRSPMQRLQQLIGHRARYMLKTRLKARIFHKTICMANAVRYPLVRDHGFSEQQTITIHNGVSKSIYRPNESARAAIRARFDIGEDGFLLICIAKINEAAGVNILVQAVSRVLRQGISCKCIILGDGPLGEQLRMESNSLGLTGHVFFEGFQRDARPYLQAGSAFILTSSAEGGLPQSLLEAIACGLPCIVTDVGGNVEAVNNQVTGLVISPDSIDEAEEAILYLATHPHKCAEMAARAYETARGSFEIGSKVDELKAAILG